MAHRKSSACLVFHKSTNRERGLNREKTHADKSIAMTRTARLVRSALSFDQYAFNGIKRHQSPVPQDRRSFGESTGHLNSSSSHEAAANPLANADPDEARYWRRPTAVRPNVRRVAIIKKRSAKLPRIA